MDAMSNFKTELLKSLRIVSPLQADLGFARAVTCTTVLVSSHLPPIQPKYFVVFFQVISFKKPVWSGGDVNGKCSNRHSAPLFSVLSLSSEFPSRAELKIPVGPARITSAALAAGPPPGCLSRAPKRTWEPVGKTGRLERFKFPQVSGRFQHSPLTHLARILLSESKIM